MSLRSFLLGLIAALLLPTAAQAKVVVVDATGHRVAAPVGERAPLVLLRWSADGSTLLMRSDGQADKDVLYAVDPLSGAKRRLGERPGLLSIGPTGAWVSGRSVDPDSHFELAGIYRLLTPDGRVLAEMKLPASEFDDGDARVAWSSDGRRVAFTTGKAAVILDVATGAVLQRFDGSSYLAPQAFAPDGSAVLIASARDLLRFDLDAGTRSVVFAGGSSVSDRPGEGIWSSTGRIGVVSAEVNRGHVWFPDGTWPTLAPPPSFQDVAWAPDGSALTVISPAHCTRTTLDLRAPGATPVVLARASSIFGVEWSPDGRLAAVQLSGEPPRVDHRRHPWPTRPIPSSYNMYSARGDRLVRRLVVRFAADVRGGASRHAAVSHLARGLRALSRTVSGAAVMDEEANTIITTEANRWLRAAGLEPLDPDLDELRQGLCP